MTNLDARADWQAQLDGAGDQFGMVLGYDGAPLPAPVLPGGRLKPRTP